MDMQQELLVEKKSENTLFNALYDTLNAIKSNYKLYLPLLFISFCIKIYILANANATEDAQVIISSIVMAVASIIHTVLLLNFFFFNFEKLKFNIAKVFWDIPTYVFFSVIMGLGSLIGVALLVIPGIFFLYFFYFLPMVAILFDKEGESNFAITKRKVSSLGVTYFGVLLLTLVIGFFSFVLTSYAPGAGVPLAITYTMALLVSFLEDALAGMVIALFKRAN